MVVRGAGGLTTRDVALCPAALVPRPLSLSPLGLSAAAVICLQALFLLCICTRARLEPFASTSRLGKCAQSGASIVAVNS